MPINFHPHLQSYDRNTGLPVTEHVADYVILSNGNQNLYVQAGQIFFNGSDLIRPEDAPQWFWDSVENLTPVARRAIGLQLPQDRIQSLDQLPVGFLEIIDELPEHLKAELLGKRPTESAKKAPKISAERSDMGPVLDALKSDPGGPPPKTWVCDECTEEVLLTRKGVHIAAHRRAAKLAARKEGGR